MENGIEKKLFTNDRSVIITTLRHVFSEKIIITAVNNGARTVCAIECGGGKRRFKVQALTQFE